MADNQSAEFLSEEIDEKNRSQNVVLNLFVKLSENELNCLRVTAILDRVSLGSDKILSYNDKLASYKNISTSQNDKNTIV